MNRRSAAKLVHYLEPCGRAVDEQMVIFAKNNFISYRRAHPQSVRSINETLLQRTLGPAKHFGIFRQCRAQCGSFNGHR